MMNFIGVSDLAALVARVGVEPYLRGLAAAIEGEFQRWEAFEKIPRLATHGRTGVIELMPANDGTQYACKYVNGHPGNVELGLQTVIAFGMLSDMATGYPVLLSEMTLLTALRTAATSALAAKALARRDARVMSVIGLGAQSEFQALAFRALLGITRVRGYDVDPLAARKFAANLAGSGIEIELFETPEEAVAGGDIVTTITADRRRATILSGNMVGPGVHINAVGGDCPGKTELAPDILSRAHVVVEYEPQTRIEGEIQQMPPDFPVTELWEVLSGRSPGRRSPADVTIFDSVGFAVEDFAALRHLHSLAEEMGVGREIDLLARPTEPRDLFGLLRDAAW